MWFVRLTPTNWYPRRDAASSEGARIDDSTETSTSVMVMSTKLVGSGTVVVEVVVYFTWVGGLPMSNLHSQSCHAATRAHTAPP